MKINECNFPDDVLNDLEYGVWVRLENGAAVIGINAILSWLSGTYRSVTFKPVGLEVERGKNIGSVDGLLHFDVVRTPLTGVLLETNENLSTQPKLLNKDPYGAGWFAKVRPTKSEEIGLLKDASSLKAEIERKISELRVHCFAEYPDFELVEIGTECSAALAKLDELLQSLSIGQVVHLVSDDAAAEVEMIAWSERTGNSLVESRQEGNLKHFLVRKEEKR